MSQCKKKQLNTSPVQKRLNVLKTMKHKFSNLKKQVENNPNDLSAKNALVQVSYDLKHWKG